MMLIYITDNKQSGTMYKGYDCRDSENQIFLSVIWIDSSVCSMGPKRILSVQINSNMIFHFNKLFNVVLNCGLFKM